MTDAIAFELAEMVPATNIVKRPLASILRERSWRNGCAKPRGKETYLNSMLTICATSSRTVRLVVAAYGLWTAQANIALEVFVNNEGYRGRV